MHKLVSEALQRLRFQQFQNSVSEAESLSIPNLITKLQAANPQTEYRELLPPTKDSLRKHVMRANYQAAVWRRSLVQDQDLPSPIGNGWQLSDDGDINIHWSNLPCAPESVLKTVHCACKTGGCGSAG